METFDHFSSDALRFLAELKANNTKAWFAQSKATYETHLKWPGKQFAEDMAMALRHLTGQDHGSKIFRIHRDVRFSKDKTPYNAHLHIAFAPNGPSGQPPMWFFGLSPEKLSLGCGVFQYDKDALVAFRTAMGGPKGAELMGLTATLRESDIRIGEPELKRVPSGFDKDHPHGEALRRKGYAAWIDIGDPVFATQPDLVNRTVAELGRLEPVFKLLSEVG